jgi:hypothetical protein
MTMKPPMKGARKGPVKTSTLNTVIAMPRVLFPNMSENTAATHVSGQAPKKPAKNLQSNTVCKSFAVAQAMQKTEKPNEATTSGSRLPFNSDKGAQRIGPVAKPNTYNDVPSVATTEPTWNSCSIARIAVLNIALAKEAVKVVNPSIAPVNIFFLNAQFCACSGSSSPSNSTT